MRNLFSKTVIAGAAGIFTLAIAGGIVQAGEPSDEGNDPLCMVAHSTGIHELCMGS